MYVYWGVSVWGVWGCKCQWGCQCECRSVRVTTYEGVSLGVWLWGVVCLYVGGGIVRVSVCASVGTCVWCVNLSKRVSLV